MWICSSKTWNIGGMSLPPSPKTLRIKSSECEQRSSSASCEISNNLEHGAVPLSMSSGSSSVSCEISSNLEHGAVPLSMTSGK